jgi:hypothetical protein
MPNDCNGTNKQSFTVFVPVCRPPRKPRTTGSGTVPYGMVRAARRQKQLLYGKRQLMAHAVCKQYSYVLAKSLKANITGIKKEFAERQFVGTTRTFFLPIFFNLTSCSTGGRRGRWSEAPCRNAGYAQPTISRQCRKMPAWPPIMLSILSSVRHSREIMVLIVTLPGTWNRQQDEPVCREQQSQCFDQVGSSWRYGHEHGQGGGPMHGINPQDAALFAHAVAITRCLNNPPCRS